MANTIFSASGSGVRRLLVLSLVVVGASSGCQKQDQWERVVVSGRVAYQGEPVVGGRIRFEPIGETLGPVSVAVIENGAYRYGRLGGVPVGVHRVRIYGTDPENPGGGGPGGPPPKELIPPEYNAYSKLELQLDRKKKAVVCDFELE